MPKKASKNYQPSPKVLACRENGRKGGLARAKKNSKAAIKSWSSKGGKRTHEVHGSDLFAFLSTKRKTVGRYSKPTSNATIPKRKKVAA